MLLAQVDKSREPTIDKTRALNCLAPATPSSVERAHCPELPPTLEPVTSPVFELPATIPDFPPTVKQVAGGEHVVGGGGVAVKKTKS